MAKLEFRDLRADEIDCRVAQVFKGGNGFSLLLYKDARCDMNILDETVGPMNWQRSHSRDNANCIVSIWDEDKKMWISKEDTGTESNTEAEKGLASDSFKRACFNWGIGRELYTAPRISIFEGDPKTDKFEVNSIRIEGKKIVGLSIKNSKTGAIVFTYGKTSDKKSYTKKSSNPAPTGDIAPTGEPMYSYTTPEQAPIAPPMPVAPVAPAPKTEKPKNPVRVEFVNYCVKQGVDVKAVCQFLKLNDKSADEDFKTAMVYVDLVKYCNSREIDVDKISKSLALNNKSNGNDFLNAIDYCMNLVNDLPTEV